ncbi:LPS assembly lipoprotein LptE [Uliginosibacterium sp. 31-16]|uniref:LPS-assembly lipoprotein LptE n=1 Tax=Uliginosibacterium sp. 31-16 TaxID=3068315 RepID=UPI00273DAB57|nr:LPS assembly lipoprotein LptE [Uliginosibacterium sp. 31-16]MDP5240371.1 LPS assembly lipoprotein LptE [Uliginosibacterium sp. 31-16]
MLRRILLAVLLVSLSACGFHLRGPQPLPFATLYLEMNQYSDLAAAIKRQIATSGSTKVVDKVTDAEVRMVVVRDAKEKHILSLSSTGTVREYELRQRFGFRLLDKQGKEVMPFNEIYIYRSVTFATGQELAKEQEEALLYRDMENDLVQQLMRRLASAKPAPATP